VAYETSLIDSINKDLMSILNIKDLHAVFTSPSGFESFKNLYDPTNIKLISIGNSTSSYIKKCGFLPIITSKMQSYEGISDSIISHFNLTQ
jgi:uroporphyrinogen-III synthase